MTIKVANDRAVPSGETRFILSIQDKDHSPVSNIPVTIIAEHLAQSGGHGSAHGGPTIVSVQAKAGAQPGDYTASLKLTSDGKWKITAIHGVDRTEFSAEASRRVVRITGDHATSSEKSDSARGVGKEARLSITRTIGKYALDVSMDSPVKAGEESILTLQVTDRNSSAPISGLPIELIPVHLPKAESGEHGGEKAVEHDEGGVMPAILAAQQEGNPGRYSVRHNFGEEGSYLLLVRLEANQREVVAIPLEVEGAGEHQAELGRPNPWFIGSLLGVTALTIAMVAFFRQREPVKQQVRSS
ncbi:MAG: hypothetical protein HYX94_08815 [Chloroflexi bacterium]|nr:hypothetical protein [Chloroflexota bacterium]